MFSKLDDFFKISERNSTVKIELIAGLATFLSMSYILFVNPLILGDVGMPQSAVFVATIYGAIIGTLISGLYANYPIAQAPGMGLNAFFSYTFCLTLGFTWQEGLFAVFISGIIFIILSLSGARETIINAIPQSLKQSITVGIGGFIAFIGLKESGIIVSNPATLISLGDFTNITVILTLVGVVLIYILMAKGVKIAIFIGMAVVAILGLIFNESTLPTSVFAPVPSISEIFLQAFNVDYIKLFTNPIFYFGILSFLMCDFFDTAGTLISVGSASGMLDDEGKLIDGNKALLSDATATTIGSVIGTSPVTTYLESLVGIELGGRTGLTSVMIAFCFALALFISPVLSLVTVSVTSPALIVVGSLMFAHASKIDFEDFASKISAFFTVIFMILTYSITNGIGMGFISYTVIEVASGNAKKVHPIMFFASCLYVIYFICIGFTY